MDVSSTGDACVAPTLGQIIRRFKSTSAKVGLPEKRVLDTAKETVRRFRQVWQRERKHLPLNAHSIRVIEKHVKTVTLAGQV